MYVRKERTNPAYSREVLLSSERRYLISAPALKTSPRAVNSRHLIFRLDSYDSSTLKISFLVSRSRMLRRSGRLSVIIRIAFDSCTSMFALALGTKSHRRQREKSLLLFTRLLLFGSVELKASEEPPLNLCKTSFCNQIPAKRVKRPFLVLERLFRHYPCELDLS